jgi:hypothetical protein
MDLFPHDCMSNKKEPIDSINGKSFSFRSCITLENRNVT